MKNLMTIPVLCLLLLIACANNKQQLTPSSASHIYDGSWEGYAQTAEGRFYIKMEIKNGAMSGSVEDNKISGYIDSDNILVSKPFWFKEISTRNMVFGKTEYMSLDRIEGTYVIQRARTSRYKWFVERPGTGKLDNKIYNIKINEKEPWTGEWKVESNSQWAGIWAMKQEGQLVKSTRDSAYVFKGRVHENQLNGNFGPTYGQYSAFNIEMHSDSMSFKGSLDYFGSLRIILKGKRIK